jgi:hypothetical protein
MARRLAWPWPWSSVLSMTGIEFEAGGDLGFSDFLGLPILSYNSECGDCGYEASESDMATFTGNTALFKSYFSGPGDFARIITVQGQL